MGSNSTKVWIFILTSSLILLILGYELAERLGLLLGFCLAVSLNFFVFFYGESPLLKQLSARLVKGQDPWGLQEMMDRFSEQMTLKEIPELYIIPQETETAFCVNQAWRRGSIGISTALLQNFSREDVEAVLAHQICHLQKLDSFWFGVTNTLANAFVGIGLLLDHLWPPNYFLGEGRKQKPFLRLLAPLGWSIIKLSSPHKKFYAFDLEAANLIQDRFRMAEVLWRLEGLAQTQPLHVPPCASHLFIVNPEGTHQKKVFKSHPSIQLRLQKLMGYYPV